MSWTSLTSASVIGLSWHANEALRRGAALLSHLRDPE
jgi:hypothetical protein